MPQLIQRTPLGLLSLLDSKAGGVNPSALSDIVQPVFDIEPLYGLSSRGSATDQIAAGYGVGVNAVAANGTTDCPPGVARHVRYLGANTDTTPAGALRFQVGWFIERINRFVPHGFPTDPLTASTRGVSGGACDFWQFPGVRPAVYVMDATATVNLSVVVLFESVAY